LYEFLNTYIFHWAPSKAIWIGGHTLSWDARCAGIYAGFGIGLLYHFFSDKKAKNLPPLPILVAATLLFPPLFIDVFTIKYALRVASNDIRYLTGLLFGSAFSIYLYPSFVMLSISRGHDRPAISSLYKLAALLSFIIAAFLLKAWDTVFAYVILEALSFWGFLSLFAILMFGIFRMVLSHITR
jgi:uncharacterized membrane protein